MSLSEEWKKELNSNETTSQKWKSEITGKTQTPQLPEYKINLPGLSNTTPTVQEMAKNLNVQNKSNVLQDTGRVANYGVASIADAAIDTAEFGKNAFKYQMFDDERKGAEAILDLQNEIDELQKQYDAGVQNWKKKSQTKYEPTLILPDDVKQTKEAVQSGQLYTLEQIRKKQQMIDNIKKKYGITDAQERLNEVNEFAFKPNALEQAVENYANYAGDELSKASKPAQVIGGAVGTVGRMAPSIASNIVLPGTGLAPMFMNASQQSFEEAVNKGANYDQAMQRGVLSGGLEVGTEMLSGGLGNTLSGTPALASVRKYTQGINNKWLKGLLNLGGEITGEGLEEVASAIIQPYIDRATYNPDAQNATMNDLWVSFRDSILPTILMQGGGIALQSQRVNKFYNKQISDIESSKLSNEQKAQAVNELNAQKKMALEQIIIGEENQDNTQAPQNNIQNVSENQNIAPQNVGSSKNNTQFSLNNTNSLRQSVDTLAKQGYKIPDTFVNTSERILSKRPGLTMQFDTTIDGNGTYQENEDGTRTIKINPNNMDRALEFTLVHELGHDLKAGDANTYQELQNYILDYAKTKEGYEVARHALGDTYMKQLGEGNFVLNDEAANDILGQALGNQQFLNSLAQSKPNIFQKIWNWIKNVLFDGNDTGKGFADRKFLNDIQNKFRTAYNQAFSSQNTGNNAVNNQYMQNTQNNTQNSQKSSFSLSENNDKTLAAAHNLTRDKLKGILELGGFPVPSIAISDVNKHTPTQFGDITVLFDKNTIDPSDRRNEVYDRDVWSPTFPEMGYNINNAAIREMMEKNNIKFDNKDDLMQKAENRFFDADNLKHFIGYSTPTNALNDMKHNKYLKYLYAKTQLGLEPVLKTRDVSYYFTNDSLQKFNDYVGQEANYDINSNELIDKYQDKIIDILTQEAIEDEKKVKLDEHAKAVYKKMIEDSYKNNYSRLRDFVYAAQTLKNAFRDGDMTRVDENATMEKVEQSVSQKEFDNWIDNTFGNFLNKIEKGIRNNKDAITETGRRTFKQLHDKYNLANVVKYMTKARTVGGENTLFEGGWGKTQAHLANRFNSIADIRNAKERLQSTENAAEQIKPLQDKFDNDYQELWDYLKDTDNMWAGDNARSAVEEFAEKYPNNLTIENFKKILNNTQAFNTEQIPSEVLQTIIDDLEQMKDIPTDYFEAKPQRAVGLDEISSVLIPKDLPEEQKQALADRGIKYTEYDPDVEGDRETKYREAAQNVLFSKHNGEWQDFLDNNFNLMPNAERSIAEKMQNQIAEDSEALTLGKTKKIKSPVDIANMTEEDIKNEKGVTYKHKVDKNTPYQRKFFENMESSKIISDDVKDRVDMTSYERKANEATLERVNEKLDEKGDKMIKEWERKTKNFTDEDVALGAILIQRYQQQGDIESAVDVVQKLADMGTEAGRAVQMFSIFQRLTPEAMMVYQQRKLDAVFDNIKQKKTGDWVNENKEKFKLTTEDAQFIQEQVEKASNAETERQKQIELAKIEKRINDKLPPEAGQSIKALRRIAMLFNPKTQVRNVVGNTLIKPVNMVADAIGTQIDKAIAKKTGVRTTNYTNLKSEAQGFKKGIKESIEDYKLGIRTEPTGSKYEFEIGGKPFNENTKSEVVNAVNRKLNGVNNLLSAVMSGGDRPFYEAAFNNSLQGQMKANNVDVPTSDMIDIATNEALQRTWNDNNAYTQTVLGIRSAMNKLNIKGFGLGDLIIPFAKTPANLTKAMVEYSPVGFVESLIDYNDMRKAISRGEMTPQQQKKFVSSTSKAIAGTILYAIAGSLVKGGKVTGSKDKDKDVANFEQNVLGIQPYSIKIGDKTFTYSWANPLNFPLAVMADTYKMSKENAKLSEILYNAFKVGGDTLLDNSFLQGIKELFESDSLADGLVNAVADMPNQFVPTFMKQIADLADDTKRQSFEYGDLQQTTLNKTKAKIPGLKNELAPQVNTFGEEIKNYGGDNNPFNIFFNPANISKSNATESQKALYDLYQETKDKTIFPRQAPYYVSNKGEKINLSSQDRAEYQKISGEYVTRELDALFDSEFYKTLTNDQKVDVVNKIVSDADTKGKDKWVDSESTEKLAKLEKELDGIPMVDYYNAWIAQKGIESDKNYQGKTITNSKSKKQKAAVDKATPNLTKKQREILYDMFSIGKSVW